MTVEVDNINFKDLTLLDVYKIEALRDKLIKRINEKGLFDEKTMLVSEKLDKLIVSYYRLNYQIPWISDGEFYVLSTIKYKSYK